MASRAPKTPQQSSFVSRMCDEAVNRLPPAYAGYARSVVPVVVGVANACDAVWPYVLEATTVIMAIWAHLEPYNPTQFLPLIAGLAMCFFGGSYLTLIAAAEALRLSAWERLSVALRVLYKNYKAAKEAAEKDGDNTSPYITTSSTSGDDLFTRKLYVVAKSIDPQQTSDAASALWTGFLTVLATIRIKFAQFITLGCAMGDMARDTIGPKLIPLVTDALPVELKKWAPTIVRQGFTTVGVLLALFLQQIVGGFHASLRGAQLVVSNLVVLSKKYGYLRADFDEKSQQVTLAGMVLAVFGFIWQLRNGFGVPFPLNVLFLPATLVEWFLNISMSIGL